MKNKLKILLQILEENPKMQLEFADIGRIGRKIMKEENKNGFEMFDSIWAPWAFSDRLTRNMKALERKGLVKIEKINGRYRYSLAK